jgi:hypothetical protein
VGVKAVPGYPEKVKKFVEASRAFCQLPEAVKECYAPNRDLGDLFLGYEKGKEKFKRPDGSWVTDDLKISYYAFVPENPQNRWPLEMNLSTPFEDLGIILADTAQIIMEKISQATPVEYLLKIRQKSAVCSTIKKMKMHPFITPTGVVHILTMASLLP